VDDGAFATFYIYFFCSAPILLFPLLLIFFVNFNLFSMKMWLSLFALLVFSNIQLHVHGNPQVPCYFIFGDSLVDNGNNNQLQTKAKVNYLPYGVDYPSGPTGRFSNGRTTADFLGSISFSLC
jgi:hypothetical protein